MYHIDTLSKISLLRVLEKYNNDYLYRQSSGRDWGGVTYLYVGEGFVMPHGPIISMAVINKEKCVSVLQPPLHRYIHCAK